VTLLKFLAVLATVAVIFGAVRIIFMFRARAMRALAARWGFRYIGPPAPNFWGFRSFSNVTPPLPVSFPRNCYPVGEIKQAWNVIEGQQNGVSVLNCDSIVGERTYCTIVGCQTKQNPFKTGASPDRVARSGEWTVLCRVRYLQIPWTMGIKCLNDHVNKLGRGSVCDPSHGSPSPPGICRSSTERTMPSPSLSADFSFS
jgi:hypothetical protein